MKNFIIICLFSLTLLSCDEKITTEQYLQSGQDYLEKKQWKAAVIEFKNALKQSPENARARFLLGKTYLQTYSFDASIIELQKAQDLGFNNGELILLIGKAYTQLLREESIQNEINPSPEFSNNINANIHALRALSFFRKGKNKNGKDELKKARLLDQDSQDVRLAWARYEAYQNNVAARVKWLQPLLERKPLVVDAWSQMAEVYESRKDIKQAESAYTKAIENRGLIHPDYAKRSLTRVVLKDYEGALQDVETLKKAGLNWPVIGHIKGLISYYKKDYKLAHDQLIEVNSKSPDYQPTQLILGLTQYKLKNFQNALSLLEQFVDKNESSYEANIILSASSLRLGQSQKAISRLEKTLSFYPNDDKILSLLGEAYITSGEYEKGIKILNQLVYLKPDLATSRFQLGTALINKKPDSQIGQAELLKAIQLDPDLQKAEIVLYASYIRSNNLEKAKEVAKDIQTKRKDSSLGVNLLAMIKLVEGKRTEAINLLNTTLEKLPDDLLTSNNLALIYFKNKEFEQARSIYKRILKISPNNIDILNKLAFIALAEKDQTTAINWLEKSVSRNPDKLMPKIALANQYLIVNRGKDVVNLFQNVSEEDKQNLSYKLLMSKAKISIGEYDHAIRNLKSLISNSPDTAAAYFTLSQAYAMKNEPDKMRNALEKAIDINQDLVSAHIALARLDLYENKIDIFKNRMASLSKSYPDNPEIIFLNSKIASSNQDYKKAIKALSDLIEDSSSPLIVIDLAKNQWLIGDKDVAISSLELWLEQNPSDNRVLLLLAQYLAEHGRSDEARQNYIKLDSTLPNNPVVLNNLAWLLKSTDPLKGVKYAQKALSNDPKNPYIKDTLSTLLLINNETEKALQYATEAATALPDQVDVQLNYSRVLVANQQITKARNALKNLLKRSPSTSDRQRIQIELNKI